MLNALSIILGTIPRFITPNRAKRATVKYDNRRRSRSPLPKVAAPLHGAPGVTRRDKQNEPPGVAPVGSGAGRLGV